MTNQIYCGDCVEVMKGFPSECIDITVTSPPYDNLRTYNGYEFRFDETAQELYRVTKQGGVVVWVVNDATIKGSETLTSFKQAIYLNKIGFNVHDTMIYLKNGFAFPESNRYPNVFEYMFVLSKGSPKVFNGIKDRPNKHKGKALTGTDRQKDGSLKPISGLGKVLTDFGVRFNVWQINNQKKNNFHPAPFPEQLAEDHILTWSNPGDIVLDPMCGSGTTCKMAVKNGRQYIGIDISEEYCEISKRRVV